MLRRVALLVAVTLCFARPVFSADVGIDALPPVEFAQLSQHDSSPLAAKALALHPAEWNHGETAHFIYHYQRSFVGTAVSVEAEFHCRVILQELDQPETVLREKAHIYLFEKPEDWGAFQSAGNLEPWTGGIQSGGSLFFLRNPVARFSDNTLGHEIVHLVLRRLYGPVFPLWLNEGLAQDISKRAHASFLRARGYVAKPASKAVAPEHFVSVSQLATMSYPAADRVEAFYEESERLVRFLATTDRPKFLDFLQLSARGTSFADALSQAFGPRFRDAADLEEKFRAYAVESVSNPLVDR